MELLQKSKVTRVSITLLVIFVAVSLLAGGLLGYSIGYITVSEQLSTLQKQISNLQSTQNVTYQNVIYVLGENVSLSQLYEQVKESVVVIRGIIVQYDIFRRAYYTQVQGSGFVYNFTGEMVIITNYHVISSAINITVTFINGDGYAASVLGSDPYADLAVLSANAPQNEYSPIGIASLSTLRVGDPVIAIGAPLGYTGSMTSGIVSALGRSVQMQWSSYPIADCIQTSAPINPGNSGGPLLNYQGEVVGVTSYGAIDPTTGQLAQGIGLAIPSSTILQEIESLITKGSYNSHSWLGISGTDMTYGIAKTMNTNVTYGELIIQVVSGGPADKAGLRGGTKQVQGITIGGDIITAINGTRITNSDELAAYLEEYTLPGQTINVTIVRNNQTMTLAVELGTRPSQ